MLAENKDLSVQGLQQPTPDSKNLASKTHAAKSHPEDELLGRILEVAKINHWLAHHSRPAMLKNGKYVTPVQGDKGLPDLILARVEGNIGVVLFVELKSDEGQLSPEQKQWAWVLNRSQVEYYVIRPSNEQEFYDRLAKLK
jgi:hypothetical protein